MWVGYFRFHSLLAAPPDPAGRPVAVMHGGVVWDADRTARAAGVRPGQTAAVARTRCPGAEVRTLDLGASASVFRAAWDLLAEAASVVEPDAGGRPEAYAAWNCADPPVPEVRALKTVLPAQLPGVDLAVGLGGSRLVARAVCPPDHGAALLPLGAEARGLAERPLSLLAEEHLLTPVLLRRLGDLGLTRCGQIATLPATVLRARFGREGERLHALCHGRDARPVRALHPPRSISARRPYPDGLPPGTWAAAAVEVTQQAARALGSGEAARCLRLLVNGAEHVRTWRAPCREAGMLARAAGAMAAQAAHGAQMPAEIIEVRLEDLAVLPAVALSLLPPLSGERPASPHAVWLDPSRRLGPQVASRRSAPPAPASRPHPGASGLPRDPSGRSTSADHLEELLARLPRGALQRGCGLPDRYERMLCQLDPWEKAQ